MNVNDMVTEIQAHGFDDVLAARIIPLLDLEHKRICATAAWPFTEATSTWTPNVVAVNVTVPGAPSPIQFVRYAELPQYSQALSYVRRDILRKTYGGGLTTVTDLPKNYYIFNEEFFVWPNFPIGTTTVQVTLDYHMKPATLAAGGAEATILLPPEFHGILMDRVLARLSRSEGDLTDGETYDSRAQGQLPELYAAFDINMDSPDPIVMASDLYWDM